MRAIQMLKLRYVMTCGLAVTYAALAGCSSYMRTSRPLRESAKLPGTRQASVALNCRIPGVAMFPLWHRAGAGDGFRLFPFVENIVRIIP